MPVLTRWDRFQPSY